MGTIGVYQCISGKLVSSTLPNIKIGYVDINKYGNRTKPRIFRGLGWAGYMLFKPFTTSMLYLSAQGSTLNSC